MQLGITFANDQLDAHIFNTFITILYMFRAISCSSSWGQVVLIQHLVSLLPVSDSPVHRLGKNWSDPTSSFSTCAPDGHWNSQEGREIFFLSHKSQATLETIHHHILLGFCMIYICTSANNYCHSFQIELLVSTVLDCQCDTSQDKLSSAFEPLASFADLFML